jgi:hypothetical protein
MSFFRYRLATGAPLCIVKEYLEHVFGFWKFPTLEIAHLRSNDFRVNNNSTNTGFCIIPIDRHVFDVEAATLVGSVDDNTPPVPNANPIARSNSGPRSLNAQFEHIDAKRANNDDPL